MTRTAEETLYFTWGDGGDLQLLHGAGNAVYCTAFDISRANRVGIRAVAIDLASGADPIRIRIGLGDSLNAGAMMSHETIGTPSGGAVQITCAVKEWQLTPTEGPYYFTVEPAAKFMAIGCYSTDSVDPSNVLVMLEVYRQGN